MLNIISATYPALQDRGSVTAAHYFAERAILAPTNHCVDKINEISTERFSGDAIEYLSIDTTEPDEHNNEIPPDFLNSLSFPGIVF